MSFTRTSLPALIFFGMVSLSARADEETTCATISIAGTECENLKVSLDTSKCENSAALETLKLECKKNFLAQATLKTSGFLYTTTLLKNADGTWSAAKIKRAAEHHEPPAKPVAVAVAKPTPEHTPEPSAVQTSEHASHAEPEHLLSGLKISGLIDAYYAYNFNTPQPPTGGPPPTANNGYHWFDFYHDQFSLSMAKLVFQKEQGPVGFRFDFMAGSAAAVINNSGFATATVEPASQTMAQAYVTYKSPLGLSVDFGKFFTPMGYEVIEAPENANYSRSLGFVYTIPIWHTGVRLTFAPNEKTSFTVLFLNGWNNQYETNHGKTIGAQASFTPLKDGKLILNYIGGRETTTLLDNTTTESSSLRQTWEAIASYKWKSFLFAAAYDVASENVQGTTAKVSSLAGYWTWNLSHCWSLSLRYETFMDNDTATFGTRVAGGQSIRSSTTTIDYQVVPEAFKLRAEFRQDVSNKDVFSRVVGDTSTMSPSQSSASLAALFSF